MLFGRRRRRDVGRIGRGSDVNFFDSDGRSGFSDIGIISKFLDEI